MVMSGGRLVLALVSIFVFASTALAQSAAPGAGGTAFLADNATTAANAPDLQAISFAVPDGFSMQSQQLFAPPGFSASVLAAGLEQPRFMLFDPNGNLLVADQGAGAVYRYPASNGSI